MSIKHEFNVGDEVIWVHDGMNCRPTMLGVVTRVIDEDALYEVRWWRADGGPPFGSIVVLVGVRHIGPVLPLLQSHP